MAFKGITIRREDSSPHLFDEYLLPPILHKSKTLLNLASTPVSYALLTNALIKDTPQLQSKYLALKSHLITFIKTNVGSVHDSNYQKKKNALASKVLTTGTQLHAIYNLFYKDPKNNTKVCSDLKIKKKKLTNDLFYCEYLMDSPHPKWEKYKESSDQIQDISIDSIVRFVTAETNWYRLFMIRLKRLFTNIMPLIKSLNYQWFIDEINRINPILSYVAWLFYVPRLTANLYSLILHTLPGFWMEDEEKAISFINRWDMHWGRLWFELLNDAVWLAVGLACCFSLGPTGSTLLTAGLYFFDAAMAFTNNFFSVKHHEELRETLTIQSQKLTALLDGVQTDSEIAEQHADSFDGDTIRDELSMLDEYQTHIDLWIEYEQHKLILSMFVTTMFSISMAIGALPTLFALSASLAIACPIVSAGIVISVCITQYILSSKIEASCPESNITQLEKLEVHIIKPEETQAAQSSIPTAKNDNSFFQHAPIAKNISMRRSVSCPEDLLDFTSDYEPLNISTFASSQ
tara:strand:- start:70 stop:1623 length:1554 start_codon:yes stop_codon:yes gene_type:complete